MNETVLQHFGILGMKWGRRRFQNGDGSLTPRGQARLDAKDNKWASTKGEKIKEKVSRDKGVKREMDRFVSTELNVVLNSNKQLSAQTILSYNNKLAEVMNNNIADIPAPSGRVLRFVAKRGVVGVHTAVADAGYDMRQLNRGVFKSGKVAYKKQNLMKGGG